MSNSEPRIQCSNSNCVASNDLEADFCHACKTPITKRYLRALEEAVTSEQINRLVGDRYLALSKQVFLDTKPNLLPQIPENIPPKIVTYLQLFALYPHIPQVYGQLEGMDIWLLDYGTVPVFANINIQPTTPIIPLITSLWQQATALQQLNWLQQLAQLWQPLKEKQVVSSLLIPQSIGINGLHVQLLQLEFDRDRSIGLQDLGRTWKKYFKSCAPEIKTVVERLCELLELGSIETAKQLTVALERAIEIVSESYEYSCQIYTASDVGPSRQKNQDAVFPAPNSLVSTTETEPALAIVCDGVGGHEGGEIAATEAIEQLQTLITKFSKNRKSKSSKTVIKKLNEFINSTNDAISERNDSEHRQERQRMGTTLVMALTCAHEVYLAHVGDSRIYCITPSSCHQVTIDDDLASREVRLGYAVYRDSLQYPSAGALIQAIGMRDSVSLHPNIQRHFIDRDCIFLLCSDGLSDFERVEQYWQKVVVPVLHDQQDLASAVKTLIKIANERNGHDNATVALVHCRIKPKPNSSIRLSWSEIEPAIGESTLWSQVGAETEPLPDTEIESLEETPTAVTRSRETKNSSLLLKILAVSLLVAVGALLYFYLQSQRSDRDSLDTRSNIFLPEAIE